MAFLATPVLHERDLRRKIWTRDEVAKLAEILPEQRLELIEGELIDKMGQKPPHARVISILDMLLNSRFPGKVRVQLPITLPDPEGIRSEPEPDVVLLSRGVLELEDHPRPADIALLIEVSDSTLQLDREIKSRLYSRCGIGEYWIVDIPQRRVLVFQDPGPVEYNSMKAYSDGEVDSPSGFRVALADLFA